MIHQINEEIYIIVNLVLYGIYLVSTYDILIKIEKFFKYGKIKRFILELIFWIFQITITYFFSYKLAKGYIPSYFILFHLIGVYLYFAYFSKKLNKNVEIILLGYLKISPFIKKMIQELVYSKELWEILQLKRYKKVFKTNRKSIPKNENLTENKEEYIS